MPGGFLNRSFQKRLSMSIYTKIIDNFTSADLQELLDEHAVENIRLEFKLERPDKDETLKKLSSFANTYGGYLIIGAKAGSADGVLIELPGIDEARGFKQQIVQWCYDGASPPIEVFVSPPIPAPRDSKKICYVIYVPESEEAPRFLNSRKGVYIRTDEFSQRFQAQLATYDEIQHLANRRATTVERKERLIRRAEERFDALVATKKGSEHD
jgi:predicted HTH transcriptional regulator